ncbi:hypothetical protein [Peribacillus sp. SI8-4]|uniref:hypothetical protein n=1 Tax=Peribacillus sp. SI8-4 TaxID=3048009 RepID=UPI0025553BC1|nr:hypothetical protein [Peribacillus sp. SI8-4]
MEILIPFVLVIVGLFILYTVIEAAVRKGINRSIIGQIVEEKYDMKKDKRSFLDDDLDNDE